MNFSLKLIGTLLAVKPHIVKTPIKLPDWKRVLIGEVIAIGPDVPSIALGAKIGFGAAKGMEAVYDGVEVRILKMDDVDFVYEIES